MVIIRTIILMLSTVVFASCDLSSDKKKEDRIILSVQAENNNGYIQFFLPEQISLESSVFKIGDVETSVYVEPFLRVVSMPLFDTSKPFVIESNGLKFRISFIYAEPVTIAKPTKPIVYLNGCSYIAGDL